MTRLHRELLEAALDQPRPTPELREALRKLLRENSHAVRDAAPAENVIDLMLALKQSLADKQTA